MDQKERRNYCQEIMNEALVNAELEDVVDLLKTLLLPIVESITGNNDYSAKWDHESQSWK